VSDNEGTDTDNASEVGQITRMQCMYYWRKHTDAGTQ
jgi:hypothetical protein